MLKYFILAVLCLILYQFMDVVLEGLEGGGESTTNTDTETTTDSSSSNNNNTNNNCGMSLTDRNVFLLNDRVNALQTQYTDMSGNLALLNRQMEDLMKQNENAASDMVGNEPLDISTGGNDMPQTVGESDAASSSNDDDEPTSVINSTSSP